MTHYAGSLSALFLCKSSPRNSSLDAQAQWALLFVRVRGGHMTRWSRSLHTLAFASFAAVLALPALPDAQAPAPVPPAGPTLVAAQKALPWAFPIAAPGQTRHDDGKVQMLPGAARGFTVPEINDPFAPPDWYPNEHPPAPPIVATGRRPDVRACGQCHMLHGLGHPESSSLAGLPASYIRQQMEDFKTNARKNSPLMRSE